jgi:3-isopropylmalate/(R)-2-methylmalate dehydratase small subunit
VRVGDGELERLVATAEDAEARVHVDLEERTLTLPGDETIGFPVDPFARECLLRGVDQMGYLLARGDEIGAFEAAHPLPPIGVGALDALAEAP